MPFCPQCGVENPPSARFCDQCGAQMIPVPAQGPAAPPPQAAQPVPPVAPSATATAGPSVCPQCGTAVIPGEAFCDNCGAALLGPTRPAPPAAPGLPYGGVPPQPAYPPPQPVSVPPLVTPPLVTPPSSPVPPPRATLAPARLVVIPAGAALALPSAPQAVVGRADAVSNFFPDLDLTPHGALEHGVGRRHARLFVQGGQLLVEDLDSTNGTFLNGARLAPRQPAPLQTGDELRLGNLVLRVEL